MKLLWLNQEPGTQTLRVDTLLACFDLSSSREELQAVESPFQALCCVLTYLFVQVTLPWRAHALGAAAGPAPSAPVSGVGAMNTGFLKYALSQTRARGWGNLLLPVMHPSVTEARGSLQVKEPAFTLLLLPKLPVCGEPPPSHPIPSLVPAWVLVSVPGVPGDGEMAQLCTWADWPAVPAFP